MAYMIPRKSETFDHRYPLDNANVLMLSDDEATALLILLEQNSSVIDFDMTQMRSTVADAVSRLA